MPFPKTLLKSPRRSRAGKRDRLARTVVLATVAAVFALFWLARELELDRDELLDFLATSLLFVAVLIGFSAVGALVLWLIRRAIQWLIKADR